MTDEHEKTVHLGIKDWIGIVAVALTVVFATLSAFVHHDRTLTTLVVQQHVLETRLSKIENSIEAGFERRTTNGK